MKKLKNPSAGNKHRRKGNGQPRPRTAQPKHKENSSLHPGVHDAKSFEPTPLHLFVGRKPQRDREERKRELWERKQAELETRWTTARSRQIEEDTARKRTIKIVWGITGTVLATLLCILVWYFA